MTSVVFSTQIFAQAALQSSRPNLVVKPTLLDWRSVKLPNIDYARMPLSDGGALYLLPTDSTQKFKIQLVFATNIFALPPENRPALGALTSLLMLNGFGGKTYEQIENYLTANSISLKVSLNQIAQLTITAEALKEDYGRVLTLLKDILLKQNFNESSLKLWKQQSNNNFQSLLNFNTTDKQFQLLLAQTWELAFGSRHYFAQYLKRQNPKATNSVTLATVKSLFDTIVKKNELTVLLAGSFEKGREKELIKLTEQLHSSHASVLKWLPPRLPTQTEDKIKLLLIRKNDLSQCQILFSYFYNNMGKLNEQEYEYADLIEEIFSSKGGTVGNDRFSKALRAKSGLSYSPSANFNPTPIYPNTNVSNVQMIFQSPNERIDEAVTLAKQTWENLTTEGITQEELDNKRISLMNRVLATEETIFDKSSYLASMLIKGKLPEANTYEKHLLRLEQLTDLNLVNDFIKNSFAKQAEAVMVIIGNPDEEKIDQLKDIEGLDFVEMKEIDSLVNSLQSET